jgi:hypothetical protein
MDADEMLSRLRLFDGRAVGLIRNYLKPSAAQTIPNRQTKTQSQTPRQLSRYILIVFINLAINYFGLKLCVEILGWYPTPSKMFITLITVAVSYLEQKHFTFAKQ